MSEEYGMGMGLSAGVEYVSSGAHVNGLLLETGDYILLETGDALLQE
jgi:hypothetical protein